MCRSLGRWGFACCHSLEKNSYCTGAAGRQARAAKPTDLLELKARGTDGLVDPAPSMSPVLNIGVLAEEAVEEQPNESLMAMHQKNGQKGQAKRSKAQADGEQDDDVSRQARIKAVSMARLATHIHKTCCCLAQLTMVG